MTTPLPNVEDWATLSEDDRTTLIRAYFHEKPENKEESQALFNRRYDACEAIIQPYIESLGQFDIVDTHKHQMADNVQNKWGHERLVSSLVHGIVGVCRPMEIPVAKYWIDQHRAGKTTKIFGGDILKCWSCGAHASIVEITGNTLRPLQYDHTKPIRDLTEIELHECPIDPTLPYSVEIDVPSGKMVVANHLSPLFKEIENKYSDEKSINHLWGRKTCTEEYARQGYVEMNIGDGACRMYRTNGAGSQFVMGDSDCVVGCKEVADVCTDFWGYGVADFDLATKNGLAEMQKDRPHMRFYTVECKPGRYRFTHQYHLCRRDEAAVYTRIEWVGEARCHG